MRKVAWFQCLSCQLTLTWGQWIFSRLLNPDRSIPISCSPAVCKDWSKWKPKNLAIEKFFHGTNLQQRTWFLLLFKILGDSLFKMFSLKLFSVNYFGSLVNAETLIFAKTSRFRRFRLWLFWAPKRFLELKTIIARNAVIWALWWRKIA